MARVTDYEVKEILDTDIDTTPFITAANLIVTDILGTSDLNSDLLMEIERWLAAHLASVRDQQPSRERIGDAEIYYRGTSGLGLNATLYGQQVMMLDTTGAMSNIGKKKVLFTAIDLDLDDNY